MMRRCPMSTVWPRQGHLIQCIWLQGLRSTMPPGYQLAMVGQGSNCHSKRCTRSFKIRKICFTLCQVPSTQVGLFNGIQYNLHWKITKKKLLKLSQPQLSTIWININFYTRIRLNKGWFFYLKHRNVKLFGIGILSFPPEAGYKSFCGLGLTHECAA